jgi:hypothetical protein
MPVSDPDLDTRFSGANANAVAIENPWEERPMTAHRMNRVARDHAVEQSLDAAIEVDEIIRGARLDAPALKQLIFSLIGSPGKELNTIKKDLFNDSRLINLYYRAAASSGHASAEELDRVLDILFSAGVTDLAQMPKRDLAFIREFCLGLNQELVSEAFSRTPEPPLARSRQQKFSQTYGH